MIYNKEIKKVHGPYKRKDGRKHVIVVFIDNTKKTISYPKYLLEQHLGRELDPDLETVDHIDRDFTNDELSNLQIKERVEHCMEDVTRVELIEIKCPICLKIVKKDAGQLAHNKKLGKAGPFCSKSCAGIYGAYVQNGYMEKLGNTYEDIRKYYKINKQ